VHENAVAVTGPRFPLDCSETCTPLYPPHVFYLQLLSEQRSRVNACAKEGGGIADRLVCLAARVTGLQ
jgi:hypothetical protein